jgi:hypothetical protein
MMTMPPKHLVLVEPMLHLGDGNSRFLDQLARFGWPDEEIVRYRSAGISAGSHRLMDALLSNRLARLERWGVKEVVPAVHRVNINLLRPSRIVVLVRDIRDVALSYIEKFEHEGRPSPTPELLSRLLAGTTAQMSLADDHETGQPVRVVRYEDLVSSAEERSSLGAWLDWPLEGDPTRGLMQYRRTYEVGRHGGAISARSVGRHKAISARANQPLVDGLAQMMRSYQRRFGYMP